MNKQQRQPSQGTRRSVDKACGARWSLGRAASRLMVTLLVGIIWWAFPARGEGGPARLTFAVSAIDDTSGQWTVQDVSDPSRSEALLPAEKLGPYSDGTTARWFRVQIANGFGQPLVLNLKRSAYTSLKVFEQEDSSGSMVEVYNAGRRSLAEALYPHFSVFLGDDSRRSNTVLWVRVTSLTRLTMPMTVTTREGVALETAYHYVFLGLYYGAIAVMFFYNGFLYFFLRDFVYLFYTIYLTVFGLTQLAVDGFLPGIFQAFGLAWDGHLGIFLGIVTVMLLTLYSRSFLRLAVISRPLERLATAVAWVFAMGALASPFFSYPVAVSIVYLFNIVCALLLLVLGVGAYVKGYKPARYFVFGNLLLIAASILLACVLLGLFAVPGFQAWHFDYLVKVGSAFEVVFFSFALADRISLLALERRRYEASLHEAEVRRLESEKLAAREAANANRYMAIAQMTQSLAHDIRKPFSMLKIGLDRLAAAGDDPSLIKELVAKIREHVGKAFEDVNRMIADVMEASSGPAKLHREPHSITASLATALFQTFRYHPQTDIDLRYDLRHEVLADIDEHKIRRVLLNLLDNARQAMGGKGLITVTTSQIAVEGRAWVRICILNTNSFIPLEDQERIFEPFFSKGKKGGTGLGLAICQKIIEAHGGKIQCESTREQGTAFIMTLPGIPDRRDESAHPLPSHSAAIRAEFESSLAANAKASRSDPSLARREQLVAERVRSLGRGFRVLIIDDEAIYADGIRSLISDRQGAGGIVSEIIYIDVPQQALSVAREQAFDLIICDVDFPGTELNGFDLIEALRQGGSQARICIHSNRILPMDYRRAMAAGADAYLPKPMTMSHLLGLLVGDEVSGSSA